MTSSMDRYRWKPRVSGSRGTQSLFNHLLPRSLDVAFPSPHPSSPVNGFFQFFLHFWAAEFITAASPRKGETLWLHVAVTKGGTSQGGHFLRQLTWHLVAPILMCILATTSWWENVFILSINRFLERALLSHWTESSTGGGCILSALSSPLHSKCLCHQVDWWSWESPQNHITWH